MNNSSFRLSFALKIILAIHSLPMLCFASDFSNPSYTINSSKGSLSDAINNAKSAQPNLQIPVLESVLRHIHMSNQDENSKQIDSINDLISFISEINPDRRSMLIHELAQLTEANSQLLQSLAQDRKINLAPRTQSYSQVATLYSTLSNISLSIASINSLYMLLQATKVYGQITIAQKMASTLITLANLGVDIRRHDQSAPQTIEQVLSHKDPLETEKLDRKISPNYLEIRKLYAELSRGNNISNNTTLRSQIKSYAPLAFQITENRSSPLLLYSTRLAVSIFVLEKCFEVGYEHIHDEKVNNSDLERENLREEWINEDILLLNSILNALQVTLSTSEKDFLSLIKKHEESRKENLKLKEQLQQLTNGK